MSKTITIEQVTQYLLEHPDFLVKNPDLLSHLTPPSAHDNKTIVDFQHFMMNRLKNDKERALKDRKALIEISRSNMTILNRIHSGIIRLLDVRSLEELIETIITELPIILDVDLVAILMESGNIEIPNHYSNSIIVVKNGTISTLLKNKPYVLQSNISNPRFIADLYGKSATHLIKSHALLRLEILPRSTPALIAFASRNPSLFDDTQGTELIRFLTQVIERTLRQWLER